MVMPPTNRGVLLAGLLVTGVLSCSVAMADDTVSYNRDVRPILAAKCFACHGPDATAREADLRLDMFAGATAKRDGLPAIQPGAPDKSEMIRRITSQDPDERMPPANSNKVLDDKEIDTLRRWVAAGGNYEQHWAYVAPKRPAVPNVKQTDWLRNSIDPFVLARLETEGLAPSPQAEPLTLVRRLYLDVIGLPPTPQEADDWAARLTKGAPTGTVSENQYQQLVDHLLASPHYGERWARKWLDLARYADTNGYEKDRSRSIWPYRDWVIRALNADMPFNQFTIEQIAGDMLPSPTQDQLVATGFHRNTMLNEEGGIDPLEFRFYAMTDRVATTGTTWLGLTLGCGQCHTHKFDPITHRDYYRFMALLDNADEPEIELPTPETVAAGKKQLAEADKLLAELPEKWPGGDPAARRAKCEKAFEAWLLKARSRLVNWTELRPTEAKSKLLHLAVQPDNSVFVSGDITKDDTYELTFHDVPVGVTAIRLEALPDDRLPAHGPGLAYYEGPKGEFFLGEFEVLHDGKKLPIAKATESYAKNHFGNGPASAALAIDGNPETGWACSDRYGEPHQAVFVLAKPESTPHAPREAGGITRSVMDSMTVKMRFGRYYAASLGRFRLSVTTAADGAEAVDVPRALEPLVMLPKHARTAAQMQQLHEHFLLQAPEVAKDAGRIKDLRRGAGAPLTLVMRERPAGHPRPTYRRHRGEFLQTREQVTPGVPEFLPPLPSGSAPNRLALARWLVSPENPLTARVLVNRQWSALFGQGLVRTVGDFGVKGDPPTHPELLDWLVCQFMQDGWSLKKLHRLIVTSAAYRQSSRVTPELLARDPQNRLLARAPRLRVDAEIVRDVALSASGLLNSKMYGPPVRPPQPVGAMEGLFGGAAWPTSTGDDRYRRGLYTFAQRSIAYAMFTTFDGPSGETCIAQREVSNTPLQSLTLLNDEVYMEAAAALGKLAGAESGSDVEKVTRLMRRCVTRAPQPEEVQRIVEFLNSQRQRLAAGELDASKLISKDEKPTAERAAWTLVARALLNLDETITRN